MKQLGIVGQSVKRRDGLGHVTGQTQYVDDVFYPNMLWISMVRSPVARGTIRNFLFVFEPKRFTLSAPAPSAT